MSRKGGGAKKCSIKPRTYPVERMCSLPRHTGCGPGRTPPFPVKNRCFVRKFFLRENIFSRHEKLFSRHENFFSSMEKILASVGKTLASVGKMAARHLFRTTPIPVEAGGHAVPRGGHAIGAAPFFLPSACFREGKIGNGLIFCSLLT